MDTVEDHSADARRRLSVLRAALLGHSIVSVRFAFEDSDEIALVLDSGATVPIGSISRSRLWELHRDRVREIANRRTI